MKQKINYKYVCLLMMLITVCLFGCSQTVMAAADDSITCGLSKESRSSAVVQKSRHTSNVKLYKCDGSYWKTIKNTNGRAVFPAVDSKTSNMVLGWSKTRGKHTLSASDLSSHSLFHHGKCLITFCISTYICNYGYFRFCCQIKEIF